MTFAEFWPQHSKRTLPKLFHFLSSQDDGGWSPIIWAAEFRHAQIVRYLLEAGANPNLRDNVSQQSIFRPSATVSRIGLMESCLHRRCCGGPPPPPKLPVLLRATLGGGGSSTATTMQT